MVVQCESLRAAVSDPTPDHDDATQFTAAADNPVPFIFG